MTAAPATTTAPAGLADWIAPARTALLIIDMQVDFAAPHGAMGRWGMDLAAAPSALAAAERLAKAARAAGAPVVFVALMTSPKTDSPAWGERMRRRGGDPLADSAVCRVGEPGSDFYGPEPKVGDHVVIKTRYSGFHRTDLDATLKGLRVDTLVVCGLTTECCVDCTARDAFHLDYQVFVAGDACAAYEPELHKAALTALELSFAIGVTTEAVVEVWTGAASLA
jgi:nicotinamidase-related amidase